MHDIDDFLNLRHDATTCTAEPATADRPVSYFSPLHYEPNYAYPLLVWLHGQNQDETSLREVMPHVSLRNFVAAAPSAPREGWLTDDDADQAAVESAIRQAADRYHVHTDRVFLVGYQAGGTAALRMATAEPRRFAGAAALCGRLSQPTGAWGDIESLRELPLLLGCCGRGDAYPQADLSRDMRLLHAAGMNATYRIYSCEDSLQAAMLADVNAWAMEQFTGVAVAAKL